jgi:ABC-2 type transport system permease protein
MNTYAWLVRREFWENRSIWVVPAIIGGVLMLAALFGRVDLVELTSAAERHAVGGMILFAFGVTFFVVMSIYSTWYLLDCLYADRKDRSVLFWKSLPISDTATVLSKLVLGLIIIPLVYFAAADVTTLLMAFIISVRASALIGSALWQPDLWLQLQALWLYLIITTAIWYLPIAAWLMVISAWARRAVMLWAILPPLALYWAERKFIGSNVIGRQLADRLFGFPARAFHYSEGALMSTAIGNDTIVTPRSIWVLLDPGAFFASPATWIGAVIGIALIYGAIQLRYRRTEQ